MIKTQVLRTKEWANESCRFSRFFNIMTRRIKVSTRCSFVGDGENIRRLKKDILKYTYFLAQICVWKS